MISEQYQNTSPHDAVLTEEEKLKMRNAALVKLAVMCALFSAMILFGSLGWFVSNKNANGNGMSVSISDLPFELKTTGSVVPNNNLIAALGYEDGTATDGGVFSENAGNMKWMLDTSDTMASSGLCPGTQGALNFTIVPKIHDSSQNLTVTYSLNLKAYKLSDAMKEQIALISNKIANNEVDENNQPYTMPTVTLDDLTELSSDSANENYSKALDYIKGHILFFKNADNTGRFVIGETQTVSFNCASDKTVPLHWVWPETLGNMVMTNSSYTNVCQGEEKTALISHIQNNPPLFFVMNNLDSDMLDSSNHLNANVLGTDLTDYYPALNLAYNNADQVIGTDAQYILIELAVDGTLSDAE